ncbi:MAG: hypothetical protein IJ105_04150 [Bacilli bacterium]|nr:hypothetical protein [Bacilli bacterium]
MTISEIKETLTKFDSVSFKLYSLIYIIEKNIDGTYSIYPTSMPKSKRYYRTLDELLTKYRIFGENIIQNEDRIRKINN